LKIPGATSFNAMNWKLILMNCNSAKVQFELPFGVLVQIFQFHSEMKIFRNSKYFHLKFNWKYLKAGLDKPFEWLSLCNPLQVSAD
jgi:hypothetical protein